MFTNLSIEEITKVTKNTIDNNQEFKSTIHKYIISTISTNKEDIQNDIVDLRLMLAGAEQRYETIIEEEEYRKQLITATLQKELAIATENAKKATELAKKAAQEAELANEKTLAIQAKLGNDLAIPDISINTPELFIDSNLDINAVEEGEIAERNNSTRSSKIKVDTDQHESNPKTRIKTLRHTAKTDEEIQSAIAQGFRLCHFNTICDRIECKFMHTPKGVLCEIYNCNCNKLHWRIKSAKRKEVITTQAEYDELIEEGYEVCTERGFCSYQWCRFRLHVQPNKSCKRRRRECNCSKVHI